MPVWNCCWTSSSVSSRYAAFWKWFVLMYLKCSPTGFFSHLIATVFSLIIHWCHFFMWGEEFQGDGFCVFPPLITPEQCMPYNICHTHLTREKSLKSMREQRFHGNQGLSREGKPQIAPYWRRRCGVCTVLSDEPETGPAVHALWYASPCRCSLEHGIPVAWPVLRRDPKQYVEQEMVVAQGRERQVLGRREVYGRMRTKVHLRQFVLQVGTKLV